MPGALAVAVWFRQPSAPAPHPPVKFAAPAAESRSVKIITDAELAALFRDRPFALIGAPGEQRLVFLDAPSATENTVKPQ